MWLPHLKSKQEKETKEETQEMKILWMSCAPWVYVKRHPAGWVPSYLKGMPVMVIMDDGQGNCLIVAPPEGKFHYLEEDACTPTHMCWIKKEALETYNGNSL